MTISEKTFAGEEILINYAEGPAAGSPLVLLHGGSARWQSWESIIPELTSQWHIFAPDLRGHGKSGRAAGYRFHDFAADIAGFLHGVVGEPAALFGHSLGGIVALLTAAQHPGQVRAVIVGDSPLNRDTFRSSIEGTRPRLEAWAEIAGGRLPIDEIIERLKDSPGGTAGQSDATTLRSLWGEGHPVFRWLAENLFYNDPAMLRATLNDSEAVTKDYHMHTLLPQITCPVLLLQADPQAGGVMNDVEVARAVQLLPQPAAIKLSGVSHVMHNENPQAVLKAVSQFLRSI